MIQIFKCRRSSLAVICILALFTLGYLKGMDVASAIAMIAMGVAGANAYEKKSS